MSKPFFRARQLDYYKSLPIYRSEEIPEISDVADIKRAVPQMPTGMEKEEETEHHLQRALSAQQFYGTAERLVIPVPEIEDVTKAYDSIYAFQYKLPKQYVHAQALGVDQEIPDYDMDSEDENWLKEQNRLDLTPIQFEEMLDRLEKGSGQQVVKLPEAKLLLKKDDDLIIAVYDYWLNKRLRHKSHSLIPIVKTEKRDGSSTNNPYVAFRRRTEKMQTRKNRKNDEVSYEKMLKLRRDLQRAVTILEMIKKREKYKKELLQLTVDVLEKRYDTEDFSGSSLAYAESQKTQRTVFYPLYDQYSTSSHHHHHIRDGLSETITIKHKKKYKKRDKHKSGNSHLSGMVDIDVTEFGSVSADSADEQEVEEEPADGIFTFRRRADCSYHAPLENSFDGRCSGDWPWTSARKSNRRYRYNLTSVTTGPETKRCIGFARRRIGRGGRLILDRAHTEQPASFWDRLLDVPVNADLIKSEPESAGDNSLPNNTSDRKTTSDTTFQDLVEQQKWLHFQPYEDYDRTDALFNGALADINTTDPLNLDIEIAETTTVIPHPQTNTSHRNLNKLLTSDSQILTTAAVKYNNIPPKTQPFQQLGEYSQLYELHKNKINTTISNKKPVTEGRESLLKTSLSNNCSNKIDRAKATHAVTALVNGDNGTRVNGISQTNHNHTTHRNNTGTASNGLEGCSSVSQLKKLSFPLTPTSENSDNGHHDPSVQHDGYSNGPLTAPTPYDYMEVS